MNRMAGLLKPETWYIISAIDTMADSPMGQGAMVPMLVWIAREAPGDQKATYFAVIAAFTNQALSASNFGDRVHK